MWELASLCAWVGATKPNQTPENKPLKTLAAHLGEEPEIRNKMEVG